MDDARFDCPNCGKGYRWQGKIAGKKVKCACTQKFRVPMSAGGTPALEGTLVGRHGEAPPAKNAEGGASSEAKPPAAKRPDAAPQPDPYELDLPDEKPLGDTAPISARSPSARVPSGAGASKCPSCNSPLRPGAVICLNCGFNVVEGAKLQTVVEAGPADGDDAATADPRGKSASTGKAVAGGVAAGVGEERVVARAKLQDELAADIAKRHHFQEKTLPLIFLGVGGLLLLINAFVLVPQVGGVMDVPVRLGVSVVALIAFAILFAIQLPCMFAGIVVISKLFGSAFGELFSALKKLAALALLAGQFHTTVGLLLDMMLGPFGFAAVMFKYSVSFAVFWVLSKKLFDELETGETVALFVAMLFLPAVVVIGVVAIIFMMLSP